MRVRLTKLSDNPNALRDTVIEGMTERMPTAGKPFILIAPPRDAGDIRQVRTSVVKSITVQDRRPLVVFQTENSVYSVECIQ